MATATETSWIDCRTAESIDSGKRYLHPNGKDLGECAEGCCDRYSCPDCGSSWTREVPQ